MAFVTISRFIYGVPFLVYAFLNRADILGSQETLFYAAVWLALWLISLILFAFGRFATCPLTHFVFVSETVLLSLISTTTGDPQWLLFMAFVSFFSLESLRNDSFQILLHLCLLTAGIMMAARHAGITLSSYSLNLETSAILFAIVLCRAFASIMEAKDVVVEQIVKKIRVYVPVSEPTKSERKEKAKREQDIMDKHKKYIETLQSELEQERKKNAQLNDELSKMDVLNESTNDIVNKYFLFSVEPPLQSKLSVDENIDRMLRLAAHILEAQYAAFIANENGEIFLSNSCIEKNKTIDEEKMVSLLEDRILATIDTRKASSASGASFDKLGVSQFYLVPCTHKGKVDGVLVIGFDRANALENVHYANLSCMVAFRIFGIIENGDSNKE